MAAVLDESTRKLRRESRTLLARTGEKSKRVDAKVKKLHSQTLSIVDCSDRPRSPSDWVTRNIDLWQIRNDSSRIDVIPHPDCPLPDTMRSGRPTLTSKKPLESSPDTAYVKPVKECYCHSETNKRLPRSSTTREKRVASLCQQYRSHPVLGAVPEIDNRAVLSSPISRETFRRIQRIDYTPRSQFLRNVQTKICELQPGGQGDHPRPCPRSLNYHGSTASTWRTHAEDTIADKETALSNICKQRDDWQTSSSSLRAPADSLASEQSDSDYDSPLTCATAKEVRKPSRKSAKLGLRKTLKSRRRTADASEQQPDSSNRSKRMACLRKSCSCPRHREFTTAEISGLNDDARKTCGLPGYHERGSRRSRYEVQSTAVNKLTDQEIAELRQFREQNYFETHGSADTLASSELAGSLQQYLLNERLFPEPVGKIHKRDLVVTMPPCATTQHKRIHYFPRRVIRQERDIPNANYKRKQCQSCPLTGHAIDFAILKAKPPLNSLALKYQKRAL